MTVARKAQADPQPKGCFVGLTTVDIIFAFDGYPEEDTKNTARKHTIAAGGPASNAAVAFSFLGGDARLISSLGTSSISEIARGDLARYAIRHLDISEGREREPTLSAIAIAGNSGSRTIFTSPGINDEADALPYEERISTCIAGVDVLLLDGHQKKLAVHMARLAKDSNIPVVLDGDLFQSNTEILLPFVDTVIFGKSFCVPGAANNQEVFRYFGSFGVKNVVATNGAQPIEFVSNGCSGSMAVEKVSVLDTLAAGDFFHGAFCYSYVVNRDIHKALRFAASIATRSVTVFGTRDWMKDYESACVE
jgi:sugar/nucleoside kinase (ribokinase family)